MLVNDCKMSILCMFIDQEHPKRRNRETFVDFVVESSTVLLQGTWQYFKYLFHHFFFFFYHFLMVKVKFLIFFMLLIARMLYLLLLVICGDAWKWFFLWMIKERSGLVWIRRGDGWLGPLINFVAKRNPFLNVNEIFFWNSSLKLLEIIGIKKLMCDLITAQLITLRHGGTHNNSFCEFSTFLFSFLHMHIFWWNFSVHNFFLYMFLFSQMP